MPGISGYQIVLGAEVVQGTDSSGNFTVTCPAGKTALGGGVAVFNSNIRVLTSTPTDAGSWDVDVIPQTGGTFGGGPASVNIRVVCATVS